MASASGSSCIALLDHGLRLLTQVLGQVIKRGDGLAGVARAFPAAKWLVAGPGARGRALRPVGVRDARLDVLLEPADLVGAAVETGRQPERRVVGEAHRLIV